MSPRASGPGSPRFTVITPSLNQSGFIERTITSVLEQGYPNLEFFVVDGGSTDGSVEIIERYAEDLTWWVSEPDEGQTDALNKGLARATGEFVGYLNSDDYYLPGALDAAVEAFAASGAEWVVGASRFEDAEGRQIEVWRPTLPIYGRPWWITAPWGVPQPSSFWRRRVFEQLGPFRQDLHYVFDTEHELRLVLSGRMPATVDRELAVRVLHDEAKSADPALFQREAEKFDEILRHWLTPAERLSLRFQRAVIAMGGRRPLNLVLHAQRSLARKAGLDPARRRSETLPRLDSDPG